MKPFLNISDISSLTGYEFESACRHFTEYAYLDNNKALCRILTKYKIYVDTRDVGITPHLIIDGFWETWLTQCLARIIRPGDVCIDVGANFGYYSVLMSELAGKTGSVVAVEPNPAICDLLRSTASMHPFRVAEVALSNKTGKAVLNVPDNYFGDGSILSRPDRLLARKERIKIRTITLDELSEQMYLSKIDVIKIDVEGMEPQVFEGMQKTLANNPGIKIITEYSPFLYENARGFNEYLFSNFIVHRIKDVDEMVQLDHSAMEALIELKDHTDLYLSRKN